MQELRLKADLHRTAFEWDSVRVCFKVLLLLDSMDVNNLWDFADFLRKQNIEHLLAIKLYKKALILSKSVSKKAGILNNLGAMYMQTKDYEKAEQYFNEVLNLLHSLDYINSNEISILAAAVDDLGAIYFINENYTEAERAHRQALQYCKILIGIDSNRFVSHLIICLNNLGGVLYKIGAIDEAGLIFQEALTISRNIMSNQPDNLAMTLRNLGVLYSNSNMPAYNEAERAYSEACEIYKRLATTNPDKFLPELAFTLANMGAMFLATSAFDSSILKLSEALIIFQPLAKKNPENYQSETMKIMNTLGLLSWNLLFVNQPAKAQLLVEKLISQQDDFYKDSLNDVLAAALLYQGKWSEAKAVYEAWKGKPYKEETNWTQVFLSGLDQLETADITHPDVAKARALLQK